MKLVGLLVILAPAWAIADPDAATTLDCAKQPSISISNGKGNYNVVGTCEKVAIAGGENRIAIEAAKNVAVTGSKNEISVGKADKIATLGKDNTITYRGGLTLAVPKIATAGKGNTVTRAK